MPTMTGKPEGFGDLRRHLAGAPSRVWVPQNTQSKSRVSRYRASTLLVAQVSLPA